MPFDWKKQIEVELPEILRISKKCDEKFQQKCFELILSRALHSTLPELSSNFAEDNDVPPQKVPTTRPVENATEKSGAIIDVKFNRFLSENSLSFDVINNLIDLESGQILSTKLGGKGSDINRNVAVLLSLWNFSKNGIFSVSMSKLKEKTKEYGVEFHNQPRDLRNASFEGRKVYIENGDEWKIPTQNQGYVVETIKELISPKEKIKKT